jgi:hypothetical protein
MCSFSSPPSQHLGWTASMSSSARLPSVHYSSSLPAARIESGAYVSSQVIDEESLKVMRAIESQKVRRRLAIAAWPLHSDPFVCSSFSMRVRLCKLQTTDF